MFVLRLTVAKCWPPTIGWPHRDPSRRYGAYFLIAGRASFDGVTSQKCSQQVLFPGTDVTWYFHQPVVSILQNVWELWQDNTSRTHGDCCVVLARVFQLVSQRFLQVKMLRESEPNAAKRLLKFLEDYDKCTPTQRDQVFVPSNEDSIIELFVASVAVFKKHHDKSKTVAVKDIRESLRLLDVLRERNPRALGNHWEAIRVPMEAFLDESILQPEIKTAAFCLLFSVIDNSVLSKLTSDTSIENLFCKSFHWPNSYRLRVEPSQPCEFLPRTNQSTENWDTFSLLFEKMVSMILELKSNQEIDWWNYIREKILKHFQLSLSERATGVPLPCPVAVAACLVE
jgi:hypothetical protein